MKSWEEVLTDIKLMQGKVLRGIGKAEPIIIESFDDTSERIVLRKSTGKKHSRTYFELVKIWNSLVVKPAVHVDSLLEGSGSSRSHPETIFANLPYIEWLKVNHKKHISLLDTESHELGTIKLMDEIKAIEIADRLKATSAESIPSCLVFTSSFLQDLAKINQLDLGAVSLTIGLAAVTTSHSRIWFIDKEIFLTDLVGSYGVILTSVRPHDSVQSVHIAIHDFEVFETAVDRIVRLVRT